MRIRLVILSMAALAVLPGSWAQSHRFTKDWQRDVLPFSTQSYISLCVDGNRNVHVVSRIGYWVTLSPSGSVLSKTSDPDVPTGATSVACASDGNVVLSTPESKQLHVFSADHKLLNSLTLTKGFIELVTATPTSVIALGGQRDGIFRHLILNKASNQVEFASDRGPLPDQFSSSTFGVATFDQKRDQFLFVTNNPEHVLVYSRNGELLRFKTISDAIRPIDRRADDNFTGSYDRVAGIFPIGEGYVVNVVEEERSQQAISSRLRYQFLNKDLEVVGYGSAEGIGTIVAADGEGTVYAIAGGKNFVVVKAHLEQ